MNRIMYIVVAGVLLGLGCASNRKAQQAPGSIDVIAHRGASAYAPENTLASFRKAIELKADWFELDCTLTKDGQTIVTHDTDFERTAGLKKLAWEMDLAEIKTLDAGSWFSADYAGEPLPTLGEALELARGKAGVYIEIKNSDKDDLLHMQLIGLSAGKDRMDSELCAALMAAVSQSGTRNLALTRKVIEEVRSRHMQDEVVIQSFSPVNCLVALAEAPEIRTEMLGAEDDDDPQHWPRIVWFSRVIGAKGFNAGKDSLSPERIADFHAHGQTVAVWTVDESADMRRFADWGVDAIITNKPDTCREVLENRK